MLKLMVLAMTAGGMCLHRLGEQRDSFSACVKVSESGQLTSEDPCSWALAFPTARESFCRSGLGTLQLL